MTITKIERVRRAKLIEERSGTQWCLCGNRACPIGSFTNKTNSSCSWHGEVYRRIRNG